CDGFRLAGEIADHVLQNLHELDADRRFPHDDLGADIFNHVFNGAFAILLELHENVDAVGFGDGGQAEFGAGATRSAFNLGSCVDDALHVEDHAVGLGKRSARWGPVVEREAAFIHFWHQVGIGEIQADTGYEDKTNSSANQPPFVFHSSAQPSLME